MAAIAEDKQQQAQPETVSAYKHDAEKGARVTVDPDSKNGTDSDSDDMQEGVRRVRAITTIWTKKTLWSMFAL